MQYFLNLSTRIICMHDWYWYGNGQFCCAKRDTDLIAWLQEDTDHIFNYSEYFLDIFEDKPWRDEFLREGTKFISGNYVHFC